jgi:hypothetical protein
MKKLLKDAYLEAKKVPKSVWVAAVVIPGGFVALTTYLAGKSVYKKLTKDKKDDRSENS